MQNRNFQISAKFMQNQKKNLTHLRIDLVETIALIIHPKVVFKKVKVIYTKKYTTCT